MTAWSRYIFGASLVFGVGVTLLSERLPQWWGPASIIAMIGAASVFLLCSVLEYRREHAQGATSEQ